MNLRKDHYRIFVRINFRQKKQRCIHLCLQTGRDFGFVRRSARLPRELWFLAVRYCRRRRTTHGLGSLMWTQWGLLSSMFARKGRQCFKHSFQCHGVPVPEFHSSFGESTDSTRSYAFGVLLCCATVQRGRPQPWSSEVFPPGESAP